MSKSVKFSRSCKTHDGTVRIKEEMHSLIGSHFGITENNIKKVGIRSEQIDTLIDLYVKNKKTTEGLSTFLRMTIKSKKIYSEKISPLKTPEDVRWRYPDYLVNEVITNLESAVENAKEKIREKFISSQEEMQQPKVYRETDAEWERTCRSPVCYDRKCCLDKKAKKKSGYKVSLIRSGSLDYSIVLPIEYVDSIYKLIAILKEGKGYETGSILAELVVVG
jgi:hypothetical protein